MVATVTMTALVPMVTNDKIRHLGCNDNLEEAAEPRMLRIPLNDSWRLLEKDSLSFMVCDCCDCCDCYDCYGGL